MSPKADMNVSHKMASDLASALLALLHIEGVNPQSVCVDSRQVLPGDVFLAYPGHQSDGRRFIADAIAKGASAVVWERDGFQWDPSWDVPNLPTDNLQWLAGFIAAQVLNRPSDKLWIVGVTGTNGKTSVSQWLARAFSSLERRCGVIGTLGMGFPGQLEPSPNTTPDATVLQKQLVQLLEKSAQAVAMEISSIGLDQGRANGCEVDIAVFTNLTRDHLDYHGTMDAYAQAKAQLFELESLKSVVLNFDDAMGVALARRLERSSVKVVGYTLIPDNAVAAHAHSMLVAEDLKTTHEGMSFTLRYDGQRVDLTVHMVGQFNVSNLLAVIGTLLESGYVLEDVIAVVKELCPPEGRMQTVGGIGEPLVVVDYAHTPDALEQALLALKPTAQARKGSLLCLFGCGGDRDAGKRSVMGEVAVRLANHVILTSDNPRSEVAEKIIDDIAVCAPNAVRITDRAEAILSSITQAQADDVILIAGKGHETYQEISGIRTHFSDIEQARAALKSWSEAEESKA